MLRCLLHGSAWLWLVFVALRVAGTLSTSRCVLHESIWLIWLFVTLRVAEISLSCVCVADVYLSVSVSLLRCFA